jgi:Icc-related predicted phosphoesterase
MTKLRIACISDLHEQHREVKIPVCDLLVVAGDLTYRGSLSVLRDFNKWISELKQNNIIREAVLTLGNHDLSGDPRFHRYYQPNFRETFKDCALLMDESFEFEGLKIYASPQTPEFGNWAFLYQRGYVAEFIWSKIPEDVQLLVTHGPPEGILDLTEYGNEHVGCEELYKRVMQLPDLVVHCFGHIHEMYGTIEKDDKLFINASSCTLQYKPTNKAIVVDIEKVDDKWKVIEVINISEEER